MRAREVAAAVLAAVCAACGGQGAGARRDSAESPPTPPRPDVGPAGVEARPVNRGTPGMRATVRWVLSPDRRSVVVVEDAVSVEAEALPDGFLYASEATGIVRQIDSVWDVAPSPDWTRLAFGRAYVLRAGERDTMPTEEWRRVEAELPEDVGEPSIEQLSAYLKVHAFPVSGMSLMLGLGLTQVLWLDRLGAGGELTRAAPTHSLHGWRVRWTRTGDTLAVGAEPRSVQDDAPPARWVLVRPRRWAIFRDSLGGTTDSSGFARVAWVTGPTMERATPVDLTSRRTLAIDGGSIDVLDGSIRVTKRTSDGRVEIRAVGPGLPLAATAGGRFIVALVPRAETKPHEMHAHTVVYDVMAR
ncbi:MAG: hypothetical protein ABR499_22420 [Gemmatimonadaceae bacterium]